MAARVSRQVLSIELDGEIAHTDGRVDRLLPTTLPTDSSANRITLDGAL
jgi:hypothetical protein